MLYLTVAFCQKWTATFKTATIYMPSPLFVWSTMHVFSYRSSFKLVLYVFGDQAVEDGVSQS